MSNPNSWMSGYVPAALPWGKFGHAKPRNAALALMGMAAVGLLPGLLLVKNQRPPPLRGDTDGVDLKNVAGRR